MADKISRYDNVQVQYEQDVHKLYIEVDLDEAVIDAQPSKSGKTVVIATTGGARKVTGVHKLNLTLYRSP